jgi:hypothetical protein
VISPASADGSPARYRTAVFRLSAGRSAIELREKCWCFVADSNRGSPACRAGALAAKLTKRVWCSLQDSNLGMSVCRTDALAAWRSEQLLVHPGGLEPPCLAAAASEAVASTVSPRVPSRRVGVACWKHAFGMTAHKQKWCWLEGSNLPPLAYEASALPDELSQHPREEDKKGRGDAPGVEAPCKRRRGSAPRPVKDC